MNIYKIINQTEGCRLEFKESVPSRSDLAKTVIAFANDAGGDIYIGVKNIPREITGVAETDLVALEEQISNIIYNKCYPGILPVISFLNIDDKHLIKITVYLGSMPPYYLKEKGKLQGTYIRVGSSNRLADEAIIAELERRKRNISFDSELVVEKPADDLNTNSFQTIFSEKTGENLTKQTLKKLELTKVVQGIVYPTNALVLLSDDDLRNPPPAPCLRRGVSCLSFVTTIEPCPAAARFPHSDPHGISRCSTLCSHICQADNKKQRLKLRRMHCSSFFKPPNCVYPAEGLGALYSLSLINPGRCPGLLLLNPFRVFLANNLIF